MTVGFVMLVHTALERAAQVARHWATQDCPIVIHVDKRVPRFQYDGLVKNLSDLTNVQFSKRHACDWGTWSLVAASQDASAQMLEQFQSVQHVYLASGSCLPLRPVDDLKQYLASKPTTNFIESVTTEDVPWTVGGLAEERFTLRFPFSWKKHRRHFDNYVRLQRSVGFKRKIPDGVVPHLGSQWWCLSRATLSGILNDPDRRVYDTYFRRTWIPDESYYQTLVRLHSTDVESRSLTLSKFDYEGKPHIFYDDHLQLLRRSDCFVARKIWPKADRLYSTFLTKTGNPLKGAEPNPGKIDRVFSKAVDRRVNGRQGLYMQSRMPHAGKETGKTCASYSVFEGFTELFDEFESWLTRTTGGKVHGHLFAPEGVEFVNKQKIYAGAQSSNPKLRDYDACGFLTNLVWNTRGEHQAFSFGPRDNQDISWLIATDPNAQISVISGAWAVPLFKSDLPFAEVRREAARLQRIEAKHLSILKSRHVKARIRIWTMADFIECRSEFIQAIIDDMGPKNIRRLTEMPSMRDLTGFGQFLQHLKNKGMSPYLVGDFQSNNEDDAPQIESKRPYLAK